MGGGPRTSEISNFRKPGKRYKNSGFGRKKRASAGQPAKTRISHVRGFGPSTKITPSHISLNSSTPSEKHFGPFWRYLREGHKISKKHYKNRGFGQS